MPDSPLKARQCIAIFFRASLESSLVFLPLASSFHSLASSFEETKDVPLRYPLTSFLDSFLFEGLPFLGARIPLRSISSPPAMPFQIDNPAPLVSASSNSYLVQYLIFRHTEDLSRPATRLAPSFRSAGALLFLSPFTFVVSCSTPPPLFGGPRFFFLFLACLLAILPLFGLPEVTLWFFLEVLPLPFFSVFSPPPRLVGPFSV